MELFFDTETSDLFDFKKPDFTLKNFPWVVQLGAILAEDGIAYAEFNVIIRPEDRTIAHGAQKVHNISTELARRAGISEAVVAKTFVNLVQKADLIISHNINFDYPIMRGLLYRTGSCEDDFVNTDKFCTMLGTTNLCRLKTNWGSYKWPKLQELHNHLFGENFVGAHDAMFDIRATMKCFYELKRTGWIK